MFHIWTLLPAVYVYWRFIRQLSMPRYYQLLLGMVVIAGCEFHLMSRIIFGTMFSPELPETIMLFLGWFFGCILFLALLLLLRDLLALIVWLLIRRRPPGRAGFGNILMVVAALLSATGLYQAVKVPDVKQTEIVLPDLPAEFDGFRLVQLTDLHASRLLTRSWMTQVVDKTNQLRADLIVVTGDMADGSVNARRADVAPLAQLKAPFGVYAITGNHEYYFDAQAWVQEYASLGLRFLANNHVRLNKVHSSIVLAGVNDDVAPQYGGAAPDLRRALKGVSASDTIILLDHRPANAAISAISGVSLQLSGHTHGGMIRGLDVAAGPANNGYVSGLYRVGDMLLYVSNGAGIWNGFPLRLGKPSEITLLTLRREK